MSQIETLLNLSGAELLPGLAILLCAYLLGSLSSAVLVCRYWGLDDPRQSGSNNPGATNVLRQGNRVAALATLAGDFGKGALAVLLAKLFNAPFWMVGAAALLALLGHLYPVFFGFRGGKGVATTLGACLALNWLLGLAQMAVWLCLVKGLRISALASLGCALCSPALSFWLAPDLLWLVSTMSVILVLSHHSNIRRFWQEMKTGH